MNDKNFEKILNSKEGYSNVCLCQISVKLENYNLPKNTGGVLGQMQPENNLF